MRHIDPVAELRRDLVSILNPVRYLGGEFGQIVKESATLTFALSFPDLYEIAMSNLAIKILYDGLNRLPSVRCERVFAPAPDFEELLKRKHLPLYTLESGIPLNETDILGVSIGYEPGITGLLSILDTGGIPLECAHRSEHDPIVLAGGCGITNPLPFARFIDAFFIGEAEAGFFELIDSLASMKRNGASRADLLARLEAHPAVWTTRKDSLRVAGQTCTRRSVYSGFGNPQEQAVCFPVPNMRIIQDHGSVEIMRGCPNGCRFCHAGIFYRPQRMKGVDRILLDVDYLVTQGGYREISLMSLSSGDYDGIHCLLDTLTGRYANKNISFQLPSLKVNSFTLPLLAKMAEVRKSGLTFAVETPVDAWQLALNKEVYRDRIIEIMLEAKKIGWSSAKFYFMIGLPVERGGQHEEEEIVKFLLDIQDRTRIQCNVNVGTFIPKPHTPYQWARQLSRAEADKKLDYIYSALPRGRFKVNTQRSFTSFLEAMMTRGDDRVGGVILEAYNRGCRLDAWEDWAKPEVWKSVIADADWNVEEETIRERSLDEELPWDGITLGVSKAWMKREKIRSDNQELTPKCDVNCGEPCGVCGTALSVVHTAAPEILEPVAPAVVTDAENIPAEKARASTAHFHEAGFRVLVSFTKLREAAYIPHLSLLEIWHKAFQRSGLPVMFTEGFNPLPRFEITQSLSLGISSDEEVASFLLYEFAAAEDITRLLNDSLPGHLRITRSFVYQLSRKIKRDPLSKFLWGNRYRYFFHEKEILESILADSRCADFISSHPDLCVTVSSETNECDVTVAFADDRPFRDLIAEIGCKPVHELMYIHKLATLAKSREEKVDEQGVSSAISFFDAFEVIAAANRQIIAETGTAGV